MVTTKGDLVFVDEELTKVIVSSDPDLRALAEALLACCEEDAHGGA